MSHWCGIGLLIAAPACVCLGMFAGPIDGNSVLLFLFAPFAVWLGIRCLRVCVVADANHLVVRNYMSTKSVTRDRIVAIDLAMKKGGQGGPVWMPLVRLIDGSTFWISTLEGGSARKETIPDRLSQLHELRTVLRVLGTDA